jgi:hypothetical protein
MGKPIERYPHDAVLPFGWHAVNNYGLRYKVRDTPVHDTWESVAEMFMVDVKQLIFFNFLTTEPDEVNWYLHHHTGCNKVSPSGNNWMFSNSANPGFIFIPPADHDPIDADPDQICAWTPNSAQKFLQRLDAVSSGMSGNKGERIKKLVRVIVRTGYPNARNLWYYNPGSVHEYVASNVSAQPSTFSTDNARRREMTRATKGAYPFNGDAGGSGEWQLHPAADLLDDFACQFDAVAVKQRLEWIDEEMHKGWHDLELVSGQSSQGGGTGYGEMVWDFVNHVNLLSQDDTHLYSAFRP